MIDVATFKDRPLQTVNALLAEATTEEALIMFEESANYLVTNGASKYELMAKIKREYL